jgi:Amt family ammonium transporter
MAVPLTNSETSFYVQGVGVVSIGAFVVLASLAFWLALKFTIGIRASQEEEVLGLDKTEIGLEAYPEFGAGSQRI